MRATLISKLSLILMVLASSSMVWPQTPEAPPPFPPPDGRFVLLRDRPLFEGVKSVTGAPFSAQATTETIQTLADGNQISNKETATVARDSAGRTRRDGTISRIGLWASAGTPEIIRIVDPVAGTTSILDVGAKTATRMPFHQGMRARGESEGAPPFRERESKAQRVTESLGTQVMGGLNVEGTRTTETIPAGAIGNQKPIVIVSERWYSSDLQETVYSKRTDPRFGTTIYQLTNVTRQEPDPALFQVPASYTIKEGPNFQFRGHGAE